MIKQFTESELSQLKHLVTTTVMECIEAEEKDLQFIIADTLKNSEEWLRNPESGVHLVYKSNNVVQGMVLIKEHWNLASLYVYPSMHGQGIATSLLNQAIGVCGLKSFKKIVKLNSSTYAAGFYAKYGFNQVGEPRNLPGGCIPFEYNL